MIQFLSHFHQTKYDDMSILNVAKDQCYTWEDRDIHLTYQKFITPALRYILLKTSNSSWWFWDLGSSLLFWRLPLEFQWDKLYGNKP